MEVFLLCNELSSACCVHILALCICLQYPCAEKYSFIFGKVFLGHIFHAYVCPCTVDAVADIFVRDMVRGIPVYAWGIACNGCYC